MRTVMLLALALLIGCGSNPTKPPERVEVVIEKLRPLPSWATELYQVPAPANGTVAARLAKEAAALGLVELLLCHRRLLARLDKGETVSSKECAK